MSAAPAHVETLDACFKKEMGVATSRILAVTAFAAVLAVSSVSAQAQTQRLRGTIERVDGDTLFAKARDGAAITLKLADNTTVVAVYKATLADIKEGDYIGSDATSRRQPEGARSAHLRSFHAGTR